MASPAALSLDPSGEVLRNAHSLSCLAEDEVARIEFDDVGVNSLEVLVSLRSADIDGNVYPGPAGNLGLPERAVQGEVDRRTLKGAITERGLEQEATGVNLCPQFYIGQEHGFRCYRRDVVAILILGPNDRGSPGTSTTA